MPIRVGESRKNIDISVYKLYVSLFLRSEGTNTLIYPIPYSFILQAIFFNKALYFVLREY